MLPGRLLGLATILGAVLLVQADTAPAASILPAEAALWEGQGVRVSGIVQDIRPGIDGRTRFLLTAQGHALAAVLDAPLDEGAGRWVEADGRLARSGGRLVLLTDAVHAGSGPDPERPTWQQIADDPAGWSDRWIRLEGDAEAGRFGAGGIQVMQGDGPWIDGAVEATGHLRYDPGCLCQRFHAATVRPWTP